jgi:hypothetical protein
MAALPHSCMPAAARAARGARGPRGRQNAVPCASAVMALPSGLAGPAPVSRECHRAWKRIRALSHSRETSGGRAYSPTISFFCDLGPAWLLSRTAWGKCPYWGCRRWSAACLGDVACHAGGERWRRCLGVVAGTVTAGRRGRGRSRLGGPVRPRDGGTRGGAGGGAAGGWLKDAETRASNSSRSHCASAQISSANAVSASRVVRSMPITLPGTCCSAARSMTDTLFI